MTDPSGGFYSAEDADSVPPEQSGGARAHTRSEGAFYIWPLDEVREVLGDDSASFERRFGLLPDGNAPFDPQNEFVGKNLLYTARGIAEIASELAAGAGSRRRYADAGAGRAVRARARASASPSGRQGPDGVEWLDDWRLRASGSRARWWGGAWSGHRLETQERGTWSPLDAAARFLHDTMWDGAQQLLQRRFRAGDAAIDGYAEDYACLIFGLLELFQADARPDMARMGARTSASAGRAVLGCRGWRMVQHDRARSVGADAPEGGLRRRGAVGQRRWSLELDGPRSPDG